MLSRVAESVYWMSRYIERAENVARFIDVNYNLTLGASESLGSQWAPLILTTGDQDSFELRYAASTRENVLTFLSFDEENPNSIIQCVGHARENARRIREIIPSVVWEQLNKFYLMVSSASQFRSIAEQPREFCERVRLASHLLVGAADATMSHGEAWHFSRLGRLLERADKTSRIVDVQYFILLPEQSDVGSALDVVRWSALLKSAGALEMYRRQHGKILPQNVADFLLLDRHFARSVHFCLSKVQESLRQITGSRVGEFRNLAEQRLGRLCSAMDYAEIDDIIQSGLHEHIDSFQTQLNLLGEEIHSEFFMTNRHKGVMASRGGNQRQTQTG